MNFGEDLSLQVMLVNKSYQQFLLSKADDIETYQHLQLIMLLNRKGGQSSQKDLCTELQIEKSYMVSIITSLSEKGYLTKETNYKDRRSKLISLTAKATKMSAILTKQLAAFTAQIDEQLSWQETHNCMRTLKIINDTFNKS